MLPFLSVAQISITSGITPDLSAYGEATNYPSEGEYQIFLSPDNILDQPIFVVDGFEFSKGYFTDRVNIKWAIGANENLIEKINIYRKELNNPSPYELISTLSSDVFEFNDPEVEGGLLSI